MKAIQPSQIIFVTGVGRSGTSLLQSILNAHSRLRALPETKFFKKYVLPEFVGGQPSTKSNRIIQELRGDTGFALTGVIGEELLRTPQVMEAGTYLKVYEGLLTGYLESKDEVQFVVDKDPLFVNFPEIMEQLFPGARLIQIIRDPRDVILSRKKSGWGKNEPFLKHLYATRFGLANSFHLGKTYFKDTFYALKYEDLLLQPAATVKALCDFLELPFESEMLAYYKSSDALFDENRETWKKNIKQPIIKDNSNKWKKELSRREICLIEHFLQQDFEQLGYERSQPVTPFGVRLMVWLLMLGYPLFSYLKKLKRKRSK